jgi:tmRNA-binding protein
VSIVFYQLKGIFDLKSGFQSVRAQEWWLKGMILIKYEHDQAAHLDSTTCRQLNLPLGVGAHIQETQAPLWK